MATLSSPVLQRLIVNARNLLNQPDRNNSFWTDEELTEYANEGIRTYFAEVLQRGDGQFVTQTDLNLVTDTETVALPTDFFALKGLYKKVNNGYILLQYNNNFTDSYSTQGGSSSAAYLPSYYLRGNNIVLRGVPNFSETAGLRIEYVQFPETLVGGGDTLTAQVSPIFKQVIEVYMVYKAKLKESMVNGVVMHKIPQEHLGELYSQLKEAISQRVQATTYIIPFDPERN